MLMRIFLNMNLTEHTGHGVPAILSRYGERAFDIGETYILVTIPFDSDVLETLKRNKNVGLSVGTNVGLNVTEKKMIHLLLANSNETAESMAVSIGVTKRTIERELRKLQEKGILIRSGSKKTGSWIVIKYLTCFTRVL